MKFFLKRLNNKKGFTLIELIVVITILAILALIAVPRFAVFTDKAKIGADQQYGALVANAVKVLIADGTFGGGGTFTIDDAGLPAVDAANVTAFDCTSTANFAAEIALLVTQKSLQTEGSFTITINDDGEITSDGGEVLLD